MGVNDPNAPFNQTDEDDEIAEKLEQGFKMCTACGGDGFVLTHNEFSRDSETGEHVCDNCPTQQQCPTCEGTRWQQIQPQEVKTNLKRNNQKTK